MQDEAAQRGLNGLAAGFSRHDFIEARMQQGATYILQLLQNGKDEEAQALMATDTWGQAGSEEIAGEEYSICRTITPS